jgi:hypothetical protein
MATVEDPITNTEWIDTDDLSGSAVTAVVALFGIGILFTMVATARETVVPIIDEIVGIIPGVNTGEGSDNDFDFGGGGL